MSKFQSYLENTINRKRLWNKYHKELDALATEEMSDEEIGNEVQEFLASKNEEIQKGDVGYLVNQILWK